MNESECTCIVQRKFFHFRHLELIGYGMRLHRKPLVIRDENTEAILFFLENTVIVTSCTIYNLSRSLDIAVSNSLGNLKKIHGNFQPSNTTLNTQNLVTCLHVQGDIPNGLTVSLQILRKRHKFTRY